MKGPEIPESKVDRPLQLVAGTERIPAEGETACQIEPDVGVIGPESAEPLVDRQAVKGPTPERIMVAQQFKGFHVPGVPADQPLEKLDLDIQVARLASTEFWFPLVGHAAVIFEGGTLPSSGREPDPVSGSVPNQFIFPANGARRILRAFVLAQAYRYS